MNFNIIILSIPIYFLLIGIEVLYSWIKKKKIYRFGDAFANIGCGIFEQVTGIFVKVFTVGLYSIVYQNFRIWDVPVNALSILVLYLGVDFLYYWAHRLSHEINLFWVGHVVHHQSEDYNFSVALRQGALQKLFTSPFYLPLAFLGFSDEWFLYISALNTVYQFWIHTETIGKLGPLEWIFNTPSHHRVHHGRDPKYIDKNHAGSLIIWDKMFGTFQAEEERPHYGITKVTGTFNPVLAHWKPIQDLAFDLKKVQGLNKAKLLLKSPGWFPIEAGGIQKPPVVDDATYHKFGNSISKEKAIYFIAQFVILLAFTAYFLFEYAHFSSSIQAFAAAIIILSLLLIGAQIDGKKSSIPMEIIRLIAFPFFGYVAGINALVIIGSVLVILSFLWLVLQKYLNKKKLAT